MKLKRSFVSVSLLPLNKTPPRTIRIRLTYYRYPNEMCYTIDNYQWTNSQHPLQQCESPWNYELMLRASWDRNATVALAEPEALPLVLHSPYSCPPDKLSSVMIKPGMMYTIAISQEKVERLPSPYKSSCNDYISMGIQKKYFGYYTQDICVQDCEMNLEMKHCQCVRTHHEFAATFGGIVCDIIRDDICTRKVENLGAYQLCLTRCRVACQETKYDVRLSSLAVDKSMPGKGTDKFTFVVKFSSDTQRVLQYQPNLSIVEAFGYFGGYIGIWLGFSLLSVLLNLEAHMAKILAKRMQRGKTADQAVMVFRLKQRF
ncbi:epithelial sodium channel subunit beta-like isoform X2 [Dermacentor andersoni]|uniref:epithelial sodium channel subunit beta-like isoform X1 n=2 Tax=Dermacentor andersoni TaxID=34620 RepID=UPI002155358E|nr:amiloride-sensitive sodium channel subunit alpha-like isoform X1 [Dermacentor andersoni]